MAWWTHQEYKCVVAGSTEHGRMRRAIKTPMTPVEARALVASIVPGAKVRFTAKSGRAWAYERRQTITLPDATYWPARLGKRRRIKLTQHAVLHECAHLLAPGDWHGPLFVAALDGLLRRYVTA